MSCLGKGKGWERVLTGVLICEVSSIGADI